MAGAELRVRAPRVALAVAVVAVLSAGVGVVVYGHSTVAAGTSLVADGAPLSFKGIELSVPAGAVPEGTRISLGDAGNVAVPAHSVRFTGGGVRVTFMGAQPRLPVQVRIPAPQPSDGLTPVLITETDNAKPHLVLATYDVATHRLVADVAKPQRVWGGLLDLTELARDGLSAPEPARPDCAGRAVSASGVTVGIAGSYGAGQGSVVWPCVALDNGRVSVTLTAGTSMSYRVELPSGWPAPTTDLLTADSPLTYDVPQNRAAATVRGRADPGPYVGVTLARMARGALDLFGVGVSGEMPGCAAAAGAAHYVRDRPLADWWTALRPCLGPVDATGSQVLSRVASSLGAIAPSLESVVRNAVPDFSVQLTVKRGKQLYTDIADYRPWSGGRVAASLKTTAASGSCWATSTVSQRPDAYRCSTVDDLLYDPCFANGSAASAQVVCPVSPTKAVLLTLTGALPPPAKGDGKADLFLFVLTTGLQCSAFTGNAVAVAGMNARFACDDHKTLLYGDPDMSGPLWTAQSAVGEVAPLRPVTIVKAYR